MSIIKLTLTEDIIQLVSCIKFKELPIIDENDQRESIGYEINMASLYGGDFLLEDIATILGRIDEAIPDTECDFDGPKFEPEFEKYMLNLHMFIVDNLDKIEEIIHQFTMKGGVTPGVYKCKGWERIWTKVE